MAAPDPVRLEIFHHLLAALCEESGALLQRSAISANIRERRDFSCALFDGEGRLMAQAAHIPVHLGSAGDSVAAARATLPDLRPGDLVVLNDPYLGGTHLPDVTMVLPVFLDGESAPGFYVVNRAHHADIGGSVPGSMGVAPDLIAEGLVLPPVRLRKEGQLDEDLMRTICANVRSPDERRIDFEAQEAALRLAETRLRTLCREQGLKTLRTYAAHLMRYSETLARDVLEQMPRGSFRAKDRMEDDGYGNGPFPLQLELRPSKNGLRFDFSGSGPQAQGGINANRSIVHAAALYAFRCHCPDRLPTNDGLYRLLEIVTEPGTLLDPRPPAPVAGGNVETSQRLTDVCLRAFARALPERAVAASAGTMSNFTFGGDGFASYETLPGGAGAGPNGPGASALQTHMTNTRNTPVEELETAAPVRVTALTVRRNSGGRGKHRGGDGLIKEVELLADATVSLFAERHREGPWGLRGGGAGKPGRAWVIRGGGRRQAFPAKGSARLQAGDRVRIETPGGGGWGRG